MPIQETLYCGFTSQAQSPVICAGELGRADGCRGCSLACVESDGRWTLRGVQSGVDRRGFEVASYTKVAAFENWIKLTVSSK